LAVGEARGVEGGAGDAVLGDLALYKAADRPFRFRRAMVALAVFVSVVAAAALGVAPISATAFAGAVSLILFKVISPEEAYAGLRPDVLLLIAGMVVVGMSIEVTGLAAAGTELLIGFIRPFGPLTALIVLYGVTLVATEFLS